MTDDQRTIRCPRCTSATDVVPLADLELDHCAACGGIWFDAGEIKRLRVMVDDVAVRDALAALFVSAATPPVMSSEERLVCPVCAIRMTRRHHEDAPGVVIDRCQVHGTWLDRGEVTRLLELAKQTSAARLRELSERRAPKQASWLGAFFDLFD